VAELAADQQQVELGRMRMEADADDVFMVMTKEG